MGTKMYAQDLSAGVWPRVEGNCYICCKPGAMPPTTNDQYTNAHEALLAKSVRSRRALEQVGATNVPYISF